MQAFSPHLVSCLVNHQATPTIAFSLAESQCRHVFMHVLLNLNFIVVLHVYVAQLVVKGQISLNVTAALYAASERGAALD